MSSRAWMPMYWSDYLADTGCLDLAGHGAYLLLIGQYWRSGGPLPDDDTKLARLVQCRVKEWIEIRPEIEPYFEIRDGYWHHARMDDELAKALEIMEKRSAAGRAGANQKHGKRLANARQKSAPTPTPSHKPTSNEVGAPSPADDVQTMVEDWNALADEIGLPRVQRLTEARKSKAKARLKEAGGLDGWRAALDKIRGSPFLTGDNPRGWRANFDFCLQESSFTKLMEGAYEDGPRTGRSQSPHEAMLAGFAAAARGG